MCSRISLQVARQQDTLRALHGACCRHREHPGVQTAAEELWRRQGMCQVHFTYSNVWRQNPPTTVIACLQDDRRIHHMHASAPCSYSGAKNRHRLALPWHYVMVWTAHCSGQQDWQQNGRHPVSIACRGLSEYLFLVCVCACVRSCARVCERASLTETATGVTLGSVAHDLRSGPSYYCVHGIP